jgi:NAD(P)-dependent dehydrogenase (short-subunit alcohol dehydrogenase family)
MSQSRVHTTSRPLDGRVVIVTGGGAGLGRGICHAAAALGATVVVAAPRDNAAATVQEITDRGGVAHWQRCDVTAESDVAACITATIDLHGRLDAVVHNATSRHSSVPRALSTSGSRSGTTTLRSRSTQRSSWPSTRIPTSPRQAVGSS